MTTKRLLEEVGPIVARGAVPGAIVGVLSDGEATLDAIGTTHVGGEVPLTPDAVLRIASNTKPMAAALTLALVGDGKLRLDDPIERFIPEFADRRVLRTLDAPLTDTVPAERPPVVEDLLTMRVGFGFVFEADCPATAAAAESRLGMGPPDPSMPFTSDTWIRRFAELPLVDQPGTSWRYDIAYTVLGVLLERVSGSSLDELFASRMLRPLGMVDTGFTATPERLVPSFEAGDDGLVLFDGVEDSRWASAPGVPDARGGLVSTAADMLRFCSVLLDGGGAVLPDGTAEVMATNRLTEEQRQAPSAAPLLDGFGWGYGVQVVEPGGEHQVPYRRYGWVGGFGTFCYVWPEHNTAAVLLTQVMPPSEELAGAFFRGVENALP